MFHVNAWGTSYSAPLVGAKLVFPGPKMADGETLTNSHKCREGHLLPGSSDCMACIGGASKFFR